MLLWVLVLSIYAGAVAGLQRGGERSHQRALGVQGLLAAAFPALHSSSPPIRSCASIPRRSKAPG